MKSQAASADLSTIVTLPFHVSAVPMKSAQAIAGILTDPVGPAASVFLPVLLTNSTFVLNSPSLLMSATAALTVINALSKSVYTKRLMLKKNMNRYAANPVPVLLFQNPN